MEMMNSAIVKFVLKMKEIVILMMSASIIIPGQVMVFVVDQIIVQNHLVLTLKLIVVIHQLLETNIFVHLYFGVQKMREIVLLIMSVKRVLNVD